MAQASKLTFDIKLVTLIILIVVHYLGMSNKIDLMGEKQQIQHEDIDKRVTTLERLQYSNAKPQQERENTYVQNEGIIPEAINRMKPKYNHSR